MRLTFGSRAIAWLNGFAERQGTETLRIAIEKDGCAEAVYTFYPSERSDDDQAYTFDGCVVVVDPTTAHFLGQAWIDLDEAGAPEAIRPVAIAGECGKTSGSCSCGTDGGG